MANTSADANNVEGQPEPEPKAIFEEVYFAIIPSDDFPKAERDQIAASLTSNGAKQVDFGSDNLRLVTHLISTTAEFPAYHDAIEGFIHVVKPSWVGHSIYRKKPSNPRQFSPDPQYFFSDVVLACADDLPTGDKDAIMGGVHAMGGQYSPRMTRLVTHLVTLNKSSQQCQIIFEKHLKCIPVLPHWFDACLRLGKKIDVKPYVITQEGMPPLYTESASNLPDCNEERPDLSQSTPVSLTHPPLESPSIQRMSLNVFRDKRIMLHKDLDLGLMRKPIETTVISAGGMIADNLSVADILVCRYRNSREFVDATLAGKDVGNIHWLYYLITRNRWSDPTRRLLHYPYPEDGVPGFSDLKIAVSNYQGETRIWLESLVTALGGEFTKAMAQDNTHLITAHTHSEKCDAAREWNIDMVNHLWLEESYAKCEMQPVTNPKYTTWPPRTNLTQIVGQTTIDRGAIRRVYLPTQAGAAEAGVEDYETSMEADAEPSVSTNRTPAANSASKRRALQTPAQQPGMVGITPGSRGAKARAVSKLRDQASDIALFEKEQKRVGGVIYGGRKVTDPDRIKLDAKSKNSRKRSVSEAHSTSTGTDSEGDEEAEEDVPSKKQKTSTDNVPKLKVLLSGVDGAEKYPIKLKGLNLRFTEDTRGADVLVLSKWKRTRKVLCALPMAPSIVSASWLDAMVKAQGRLPYEAYLFKDHDCDRDDEITIQKTLANAKKQKAKGGMLKNQLFFCTERANGGYETLRDVVVANGGNCTLFKGRETKLPSADSVARASIRLADEDRDLNMNDDDNKENPSQESKIPVLHMISSPDDKALWARFSSQAAEKGFRPRVATSDWIFRIGMSQDSREWDPAWRLA